jgi:hypothetical protein
MVTKGSCVVANGRGVTTEMSGVFAGITVGANVTMGTPLSPGPGVTGVPCGVYTGTGVATVVRTAVCTVRWVAITAWVTETFTGAFVASWNEADPTKRLYPAPVSPDIASEGMKRKALTSSADRINRMSSG